METSEEGSRVHSMDREGCAVMFLVDSIAIVGLVAPS